MTIDLRGSFARDLRKVRDAALLARVQAAILQVEAAADLHRVPNLAKLTGVGDYYRIRIGDYRIGLAVVDDTAVFVRFLHRREFYRSFP